VSQPLLSQDTPKRLLEPDERIAEVLFGLIMVLTFTGSLSIAEAGREDVRTMLTGALGCNLVWGIIDGLLYLMGCLSARSRTIRSWRRLQKAQNSADAQRILAEALPPAVAATLGPPEYELMWQKLLKLPEPPTRPGLRKNEWLGALAVALWVMVTTFPVGLPFLFINDVLRAMRVSNSIAIVLLFLAGYAFGRVTGYHPWWTGLGMVVLGLILVALTIALGG
jgi:VIT1/CCC1 family predicted Fe2+/Mn2+ transporter